MATNPTKIVKLVYEDLKTSEMLSIPVTHETLMELSVNVSNDDVVKFALWALERLKGK